MEKFIIIAGSPNSGKTLSVNQTIRRLLDKGATVEECLYGSKTGFWNTSEGGALIAIFQGKKIALISSGDILNWVKKVFSDQKVKSCDILVCCSHATRGKRIFEFFHNYIKMNIDLTKIKVIPIHKNLLCNFGNDALENANTADLILSLI